MVALSYGIILGILHGAAGDQLGLCVLGGQGHARSSCVLGRASATRWPRAFARVIQARRSSMPPVAGKQPCVQMPFLTICNRNYRTRETC